MEEKYVVLNEGFNPNQVFKAKTPLIAAKKAYRSNKSYKKITVKNINTEEVFVFSTVKFFK